MHHQREVRQPLLNLLDTVEVQGLRALELVGPVRGADGHGQRVAAAPLDELDGFVGVGEAGVGFVDGDVFFHAAQHAEFGFDRNPAIVGPLDHAAGDGDVFVERFVRSVDHHRRIEAAVDALVADFFGAVIQMHGENGLGEDVLGRANHGFQKPLVGVGAGPAGNLDDERRAFGGVGRLLVRRGLAEIAAKQPDRLFEVVDAVLPTAYFRTHGGTNRQS